MKNQRLASLSLENEKSSQNKVPMKLNEMSNRRKYLSFS